MKKLLLLMMLTGCSAAPMTNWINQHPKPITVFKSNKTDATRFYTLIDKNGEVFFSYETSLELPDTIK
jgi:hypothetical protein